PVDDPADEQHDERRVHPGTGRSREREQRSDPRGVALAPKPSGDRRGGAVRGQEREHTDQMDELPPQVHQTNGPLAVTSSAPAYGCARRSHPIRCSGSTGPPGPAVGPRGCAGVSLDVARMAVDAARRAGADYADARVGTDESESLTVRNQVMEGIDRSTSTGLGVRVLVNGRWGFASTSLLDEAEGTRPAELAVQIARAASRLPGRPVVLAPVEPVIASWRSPMTEDPFAVPLEEKVALLMEATRRMQAVEGVTFAEGGLDLFRRS